MPLVYQFDRDVCCACGGDVAARCAGREWVGSGLVGVLKLFIDSGASPPLVGGKGALVEGS